MSASLFLHYARLRLRERMEYRGAFLLGVIAQMVGYGASYLVIWLTLQKFENIGGWNWPEIAFLYSLNLLTYAIGASFAYTPMIELETHVQQGTFDPILIRPRDSFLTLLAQMFNVGYVSHILLAGSILVWSATQLEISWPIWRFIFLVLSILSGSLIQAALLTFIGSLSLIIVRTDVLFRFYYSMSDFVNYPISIFGAAIQVLLTFVIPFAFTNFFPAAVLLGKNAGVMPAEIAWVTPLVGPILMYLAYVTFGACTNRYQGAGG